MPASIPIVLGVLAIVTTVLFLRRHGFIDKARADGSFGFPLKGVLRGMRPSRTYPGMWAIRVNHPNDTELAPVYAAKDGKVKLLSKVDEPEGGPNPGKKFWRIELSHDEGYEDTLWQGDRVGRANLGADISSASATIGLGESCLAGLPCLRHRSAA